MPKKQPPSVPASLPPLRAAQLLKIQHEKGTELLNRRPLTSPAEQAWEAVTRDLLIRAFGSESPNIGAVMDVGKYAFAFGGGNEQLWEKQRAEDMETRLTIIAGLVELLTSTLGEPQFVGQAVDGSANGNRIFLVHGHDEGAIHETARWLERFGLCTIILREQPNSGRTIIEKFVDFADVAFAVVLLTRDDRGGPAEAPYETQALRARQNVILELGFFLGKLGRKRVCAIYQQGVEIPSDYVGVLFVPLDDGGAWRLALARELKAAGLEIDMNRAI